LDLGNRSSLLSANLVFPSYASGSQPRNLAAAGTIRRGGSHRTPGVITQPEKRRFIPV
jgi:hypothetical protein